MVLGLLYGLFDDNDDVIGCTSGDRCRIGCGGVVLSSLSKLCDDGDRCTGCTG